MKETVQGNVPEQAHDAAYEFAFEGVPAEKRKGGASLFVVLAGYPIALSNFITGAAIGYSMTLSEAIFVLLVADAFLIAMAVLTGLVAFETGLSTSFLSRMAFGKKGSMIFSLLLAASAINWIGINGNSFAAMIKANFPGWPIPVAVTGFVVILIWAQSSIRGYKGLEVISWIGVPAAILLGVVCFIAVGVKLGGYGAVGNYVPEEPMTFTAASASIVGSWIFGCVITPDVCRYAKSRKTVVLSGTAAFALGLFGLQIVGCLIAMATKNGDFSTATVQLGVGLIVFVCSVCCLWTTQDNNIYGASLAMQNVFGNTSLKGKVKHSYVAWGVALCAGVFAACGALTYLKPIISFLSVLMSPVPALIIAEYWFVKNSKSDIELNPIAIISWILGGICGEICLLKNFFVSPVCSFFFTIIVYTILSKAFDKKRK